MIAERFDKLRAAAEGCDALVATGLFPVVASAHSVAEKLGIRYVFAARCPIFLPSSHRRPQPLVGRKGHEMRTCPTRESTQRETPVMRPATAVQRSTAASEVSQ
jgi:hypothetical protein